MRIEQLDNLADTRSVAVLAAELRAIGGTVTDSVPDDKLVKALVGDLRKLLKPKTKPKKIDNAKDGKVQR